MTAMAPDALIWLVPSLALTGALAGVLAGLLGVGGGIVIVPVLFWLMGVFGISPALGMQLAVGTSLATIIPTSIVSARTHRRLGNLDAGLFARWALAMGIGAALGGIAARWIGGIGLSLVFGVIALGVSILLVRRVPLALAETLPRKDAAHRAMATGIGFFSALMGIGGGTLSVPTLSLFSTPIKRAVGTASAFGLVIAIPAVLGFVWNGMGVGGRPPGSIGYVNVIGFALIVPGTMLCAPYGARLASRIDALLLRRVFAVFLAVTASRMIWTALGPG